MTPFYEDAAVTLYHGSCETLLPFVGRFDLLLTDPPYGIGEAGKNHASRGGRTKFGGRVSSKPTPSRSYEKSDWDDAPVHGWLLDWARSLSTHQIIFGGNYFVLPPASCWLVWDKENGANDFADCELAWTNLDKAVRKLRYRWNGMLQEPGVPKEHRSHPTQKPEAVMRWALMQAPDGTQRVLDPFAGVGTTGVAAKRLGRTAVLVEREEKYCEIAAKRLSQGALSLFTEASA